MSKSTIKHFPVLPAIVKQELAGLLLQSDPECVIGIGIRLYLAKDQGMDELIRELQTLAHIDRAFMNKVIGQKAVHLLFLAPSVS